MDLFLPRRCAGCGTAGEHLCRSCREELRRPPLRISTPVDPHVPLWSLGPYAGPRRRVVLSMKERDHLAVRRLLGPVLAAAVTHLQARGELPDAPDTLVLVPAPTRAASARRRGGDPVTDVCVASRLPVSRALRHGGRVVDQVGLGAGERRANLAGGIEIRRIPRAPVLLIDDVATTGATLAASSEALFAAGGRVVGALVICHA